MFNLSNFDLDINDDFSSSTFLEEVSSRFKNGSEKKKVIGDINISNQSNLNGDSFRRQPQEQPNKISKHILDIPLVNESKENSLKRPGIQQEKPPKKRLSHEKLLRKFPGPAGLLPDKPLKNILDMPVNLNKPEDDKDEERDVEKPVVYSQCSGSLFLESSYQKLLSDFNLNEARNPLNRYTVEWLKKKALSKGLQGRKVPFLGLVVHSINHTMPDPIIVLRDPTGEIYGSLHREVWADVGEKFRAGTSLALRQVGVLITGVIRRQIYLNITMNNILALYRLSENEKEVETTTINKISKSELLKSFEQWLPQPSTRIIPKPPSTMPLFSTVDDSPVFKNEKETIRTGKRKTEEILSDLGIVLTDSDFNEEINVPTAISDSAGISVVKGNSIQGLSDDESLIFEEILSGIDLDEFEM